MKARKMMVVGFVVLGVFLITAGVIFAAGISAVIHGTNSVADGDYSTVGGGLENTVTGYAATVSGGRLNRATGDFSVVAGGGCTPNEALEVCIRGVNNLASGYGSVVVGGTENSAEGNHSFVGNGIWNRATGYASVVVGGGGIEGDDNSANVASGSGASVLNGDENVASGRYSTVLGGSYNFARGDDSIVLNGEGSQAAGEFSLAAGRSARALHDGAFVWSDNSRDIVESERDNEFVVRATGGVRIITGPDEGIELNGQDVLALIQAQQSAIEALEERVTALEEGASGSPQPPEPFELMLEAEDGNLSTPFATSTDSNASGGEYISATSPKKEASYSFSVPKDGTYWLWARLYGPNEASDAIYIGMDGSWDRVYPAQTGQYIWTRVGPERDRTGKYGVSLDRGTHEIQVGHAELHTTLDALFVTDDWDVHP